jgi:hypothetical protein
LNTALPARKGQNCVPDELLWGQATLRPVRL